MFDFILENRILASIESARQSVEAKGGHSSAQEPEAELRKEIEQRFSLINFSTGTKVDNSAYVYIDSIRLSTSTGKHDFEKSILGTALVAAGQPLLRKRFVMPGSATGTSIASKYLSRAFPQTMPKRILGTRVFGRAMGRAVPYVGWALIAIDVVELVIESDNEKGKNNSFFQAGGGGDFDGGGASGRW